MFFLNVHNERRRRVSERGEREYENIFRIVTQTKDSKCDMKL